MGIRETLQEKPLVGVILVIVIVGGIIGFRMVRSAGGVEPGSRFYLDLSTGEILAHKAKDVLPPLTLPSGNQGVMAHMYACGGCDGEQFVGYLEKFTDDYKQAVTTTPSATDGPVIAPSRGHLIAIKPADGQTIQWVPMESPQGGSILTAITRRCQGNARPTECMP